MTTETKQRLVTAAVVFGGIIGLAIGNRYGVDKDVLTAAAAALVALAGSLRSMVAK